MRVFGFLLLSVLAVCPAQGQTIIQSGPSGYGYGTAQPNSQTTRIVTQPIYGATVTLEHGVRVWRPIPPTTNMIVDPGPSPLAYPR